jgi:hypothetical protein
VRKKGGVDGRLKRKRGKIIWMLKKKRGLGKELEECENGGVMTRETV